MSDQNISNVVPFPVEDYHILLPGPAGDIEAMVAHPGLQESEAVAIICHPNPIQEGTMHNKVVTTLHKVFYLRGLRTLRFNYRGVGKSEGSFGEGAGEVEDLMAIIAWVQATCSGAPIVLAGFSFGGGIAAVGAARIDCKQLVTVAPSMKYVDCENLGPIACHWVLAQGEKDDVVPKAEVMDFLATREEAPEVLLFDETGHFFHSKLVDLRKRLLEALPPL